MPQPFKNAVITNTGLDYLAQIQAGKMSLEFTRMAIGNGVYTEEEKTVDELQKITDLKSEKNSYSFSGIDVYSEHSVKLTALITNQDPESHETIVEEGFFVNEVGVFAKPFGAGDDQEILYSIAVTTGENGDFMPHFDGNNPAQIIQEFVVTVANTEKVEINMTGAVMLVENAEQMINRITSLALFDAVKVIRPGDEVERKKGELYLVAQTQTLTKDITASATAQIRYTEDKTEQVWRYQDAKGQEDPHVTLENSTKEIGAICFDLPADKKMIAEIKLSFTAKEVQYQGRSAINVFAAPAFSANDHSDLFAAGLKTIRHEWNDGKNEYDQSLVLTTTYYNVDKYECTLDARVASGDKAYLILSLDEPAGSWYWVRLHQLCSEYKATVTYEEFTSYILEDWEGNIVPLAVSADDVDESSSRKFVSPAEKNAWNAHFATCETAANTAAKEATCSGFSLKKDAFIFVKFTNQNTATNPTLNVNKTGAVKIMVRGTTALSTYMWQAGDVKGFVYDGTNWMSLEDVASTNYYGLAKYTNAYSSGTSTSLSLSQKGANDMYKELSARYAVCETAASVQTKEVECPGFVLKEGAAITVKFVNNNTAGSPLLKVNGGEAIPLRREDAFDVQIPSDYINSGTVRTFVYDGSVFLAHNGIATTSRFGATKLSGDYEKAVGGTAFEQAGAVNMYNELSAHYGVCDTAAATAAKTVQIDGFKLTEGTYVNIRFTNANSAANPTLKINDGDAIAIKLRGTTALSTYMWQAGGVKTFVYDGTYWMSVEDVASTSTYGLAKYVETYQGTSNSVGLSQKGAKKLYDDLHDQTLQNILYGGDANAEDEPSVMYAVTKLNNVYRKCIEVTGGTEPFLDVKIPTANLHGYSVDMDVLAQEEKNPVKISFSFRTGEYADSAPSVAVKNDKEYLVKIGISDEGTKSEAVHVMVYHLKSKMTYPAVIINSITFDHAPGDQTFAEDDIAKIEAAVGDDINELGDYNVVYDSTLDRNDINAGRVAGSTFTIGTSEPKNPERHDIWIAEGIFKIYSGSEWVDVLTV